MDDATDNELDDYCNEEDAMEDNDAIDDNDKRAKKEDIALLEDASKGGGDKGISFRPD